MNGLRPSKTFLILLSISICWQLSVVSSSPTTHDIAQSAEVQSESEEQLPLLSPATPSEQQQQSADTLATTYCVENVEKDEVLLKQYVRDAKDWALAHGLVLPALPFRCKNEECKEANKALNIVPADVVKIAPFTLFPSPFPRELFVQAQKVHKAIQLMYFRAASNFEFLKDVHKGLLKTDQNFIETFKSIESRHLEGIKQPLTLFCNRADYMASKVIDEETNEEKYVLKQVETNHGAMGGHGTSPRITALHRRMLSIAGVDSSPSVVPENQTGKMFATALYKAWEAFGNTEAVILFLHNPYRDYLLIEAREVQHDLEKIADGKVQCFFLTLKQAKERLTFPDDSDSAILDNKYVVAVALSRYTAYATPDEIVTARALRRSNAIQVPSSVFILAQSKKMQQVFTNPGVVEKFFTGPDEAHLAAEVRKVLTRSWSIGEDEENAEQIIEMVKANPEKFVMKWNECGSRVGQTKFFGDKIPAKLESLSMEEREKFFIMERLEPMVVKNHFVRPGTEVALNVNVTPELGIHGCVLGNILDGTVLEYFWPESQMKTKLAEEEEGGVMKGKSVFDSPYLV